MSRQTTFTVVCDVDKTTTATMASQNQLPAGWMAMVQTSYGDSGYAAGPSADVCPSCVAELPEAYQVLVPAAPNADATPNG